MTFFAPNTALSIAIGGGDAPPSPGPGTQLTPLPTAPAARWHPAFSEVTLAGGKVTAASDLMGLAATTEGASGVGPIEMTDGLGRKFWRFEGAAYLNVATALSLASRSVGVFAVARIHKTQNACTIFAAGNAAAGTTVNTNGAALDVYGASGAAPLPRCHSINAASDAVSKAKMVAGSQLQVIGALGRPTADGGGRLYINEESASVAQPFSTTGVLGAEIGRNAFSPGASGTWAMMDLYELVVFTSVLSNTEGDAIATALSDGWGIAPTVNQLVVEGDSITAGWPVTVSSGDGLAMKMTDPGVAGVVPAGWRVVNMGVSGNKIANLVARRDAANTIYGLALGGRNVVACQVGANNFSINTAQQVYDAVVALISTTATGYLQRGWEVRQAINIATSNGTNNAVNSAVRTLLRDPAFKTDTLTGDGQMYAGKLEIFDLPGITAGSAGTIFDTQADAADLTYYYSDGLHLNELGTLTMALGGNTPANGYVGASV